MSPDATCRVECQVLETVAGASRRSVRCFHDSALTAAVSDYPLASGEPGESRLGELSFRGSCDFDTRLIATVPIFSRKLTAPRRRDDASLDPIDDRVSHPLVAVARRGKHSARSGDEMALSSHASRYRRGSGRLKVFCDPLIKLKTVSQLKVFIFILLEYMGLPETFYKYM